jgi:hypothetical protein
VRDESVVGTEYRKKYPDCAESTLERRGLMKVELEVGTGEGKKSLKGIC